MKPLTSALIAAIAGLAAGWLAAKATKPALPEGWRALDQPGRFTFIRDKGLTVFRLDTATGDIQLFTQAEGRIVRVDMSEMAINASDLPKPSDSSPRE